MEFPILWRFIPSAVVDEDHRGLRGPGHQRYRAIKNHDHPRGSTYTTIRELGPIIPSILWYFGA